MSSMSSKMSSSKFAELVLSSSLKGYTSDPWVLQEIALRSSL